MACPYFAPTEPLADGPPETRVRPPLGVLYRGVCRARGSQDCTPDDDLLERGCNFGYASAICERFPQEGGPDAVRFSIAGDDGRRVRVLFAIEEAHLPNSHGKLVYDREVAEWQGLQRGTVLYDQAQAYLKSYLSSRSRQAAV